MDHDRTQQFLTTIRYTVGLLCWLSSTTCTFAETVSPTQYGAIANDDLSDTAAIQRAIDECSAKGEGIVLLEHGKFIAGSLRIKSGVTLKIAEDAELHFSMDRNEIQQGVWILAENAQQVGITGPGKIVGKGSECFRIRFDRVLEWMQDGARSGAVKHPVEVNGILYTHMIQFVNCTDVRVAEIILEDSQHWTVHVLGCRDVLVSKVQVRNLPYGPYTDGIDIDSSENVRVEDCDVTAGDDAYCVKTTGKRGVRLPAKNITFERCIARSPTNGFKIGTETVYDISDVTFRDCSVEPAIPGIGPIGGLTITSVDGAKVSNVVAEKVEIELARCPIFIRLGNRNRRPNGDAPRQGSMDNIDISDVNVRACTLPIIISGIAEGPVRSVNLKAIHINRIGPGAPIDPSFVPEQSAEYPEATMFGNLPGRILFCRHAAQIKLDRCTANADPLEKPDSTIVMVNCKSVKGEIVSRSIPVNE
jgi:polygalacturonase